MIYFLTKHWSEIITGITGVAAWIFERRKRKIIQCTLEAKTKQEEIESDSQIVNLYQKALNDLKKRYDDKFEDLEKQLIYDGYNNANINLNKGIKNLTIEI